MLRFNQTLHSAIVNSGELELLPNFPNPFVEMTMLRFNLPTPAQVILRIFNADGAEINQKQAAYDEGENHVLLQRNDLREPGIYEYQFETAGIKTARRKLMMF
ncbi:MAG: Secretion system C-terminal sorting domain [Bacteroidota bacterium]|jgi:hypothetical protein